MAICRGVTRRIETLFRRLSPPYQLRAQGTSHGSALLSYLQIPFTAPDNNHSNRAEIAVIAAVLTELGFDVDVIDWDSYRKLSARKYDFLFGLGDVFDRRFLEQAMPKSVFYPATAYSLYNNQAELNRINYFNLRHNARAIPKRQIRKMWELSHSSSTAIGLVGNEWTKSTYGQLSEKVITLSPTAHAGERIVPRIKKADNSPALLWFAGYGCVHKGLDLVIDAVIKLGQPVSLHICGASSLLEPDFWGAYKELPSNIINHGFVDVNSNEMQSIVNLCDFVILPSCSEGMATSVLTCMSKGLVPIVTKETGINIEHAGILITDLSVEAVMGSIRAAQLMDTEEWRMLSTAGIERVQNFHTIEHFKRSARGLVESALQKERQKNE